MSSPSGQLSGRCNRWNDAALIVVDCWARGILAPLRQRACPAVELPSWPRGFFAGEIARGFNRAIGQFSGRPFVKLLVPMGRGLCATRVVSRSASHRTGRSEVAAPPEARRLPPGAN